jgi:hypothetical protein
MARQIQRAGQQWGVVVAQVFKHFLDQPLADSVGPKRI